MLTIFSVIVGGGMFVGFAFTAGFACWKGCYSPEDALEQAIFTTATWFVPILLVIAIVAIFRWPSRTPLVVFATALVISTGVSTVEPYIDYLSAGEQTEQIIVTRIVPEHDDRDTYQICWDEADSVVCQSSDRLTYERNAESVQVGDTLFVDRERLRGSDPWQVRIRRATTPR